MDVKNRLRILEDCLLGIDTVPDEVVFRAAQVNAWFTKESVDSAFKGIQFLVQSASLEGVVDKYIWNDYKKSIGLILAGNIPFVGFHDLFSVLLAGNKAVVKLSSLDRVLFDFILQKLQSTALGKQIEVVDKLDLNVLDGVIATGSDNTARYFESYFAKIPHVIRKSRASVAVLSGEESEEQLKNLGKDVFSYYGLGCRNVSKVFVPKGFDLSSMLDAWIDFDWVMDLSKYANNYTYYKAAFLVNKTVHLDTGFVLITENNALSSPIGVVYYEYYEDRNDVEQYLKEHKNQVQCVVGQEVDFGNTQSPSFLDFADEVDTLAFQLSL